MKMLKTKTTVLSFTFALIVLSFTTYAADNDLNSSTDQSYFEEYFEAIEFTNSLNTLALPNVNVKIYDEKGNLLTAGDEENDTIKSYIGISDLMTEVGGIKFYRLSYRSID